VRVVALGLRLACSKSAVTAFLISDIGNIDFGIRYISTKAASYILLPQREQRRECIFLRPLCRCYWYSITGLRVGESPFFRSARQLLRQLSFIYLYDHLRVFSDAILSTLFRFTNFASNSTLPLCSPVFHSIVLFASTLHDNIVTTRNQINQ
jgi:hypothetical protein